MPLIPELDATEARVIGCLIEKSVVTPDQYPLTLNSLTSACNQKTSRDPVMALQPGEVQACLRRLSDKHLVMFDENFRGRTEKYTQRFCNTRYSELQFDPAELAVITLLLLRGPQTPGELRSRSGRLHSFDDNDAVVATLESLQSRAAGPVVTRLPRVPGRRDAQYAHLFSGAVPTTVAPDTRPAPEPPRSHAAEARPSSANEEPATLQERVAKLELELQAIQTRLRRLEGTDSPLE